MLSVAADLLAICLDRNVINSICCPRIAGSGLTLGHGDYVLFLAYRSWTKRSCESLCLLLLYGRHIAVPVPKWPVGIYSGKCPHTAAAIEKETYVWSAKTRTAIHAYEVTVRWDYRKTMAYLKQRFVHYVVMCVTLTSTCYWSESVRDFRKKLRNVASHCKYPAVENIHLHVLSPFISFDLGDTSVPAGLGLP